MIKNKSLDAYILCENKPGVDLGRPLGVQALDEANEDGGMLVFENLAEARVVKDLMAESVGKIGIFKVSLRMVGEVLA